MINSIILQPLRNGEFIQFLADFLNIIEKNNPDSLKVQAQYNALKTAFDDSEKLFKISQGSLITLEIEKLDQRRDRAITGITTLAYGFTFSNNPATEKHGLSLTAHFNLFGPAIVRDNYQSETASIRNILSDWESKPELKDALTALGLNDWSAELQAANDEFYAAYTTRNEEFAFSTPESLKTKRLEANDAYYKLRDRLNAHFEISDGAEPWARVITLANQSIENYNNLLARRVPGEEVAEKPVQVAME